MSNIISKIEDFENKKMEKLIKDIKSQCAPFLQEVDGVHMLYRGVKGIFGKTDFLIKNRRLDRQPKDMAGHLQKQIDESMYKRFRWKPRSQGVFAIGSRIEASEYGRPWVFIPIGKFRFVWSPIVQDAYTVFDDFMDDNNSKYIKLIDSYTDKDLKKAIGSHNEITFDVDKYYLVDIAIYDEIWYKL